MDMLCCCPCREVWRPRAASCAQGAQWLTAAQWLHAQLLASSGSGLSGKAGHSAAAVCCVLRAVGAASAVVVCACWHPGSVQSLLALRQLRMPGLIRATVVELQTTGCGERGVVCCACTL